MKQKLTAIISLIALTFIMAITSCAPIIEGTGGYGSGGGASGESSSSGSPSSGGGSSSSSGPFFTLKITASNGRSAENNLRASVTYEPVVTWTTEQGFRNAVKEFSVRVGNEAPQTVSLGGNVTSRTSYAVGSEVTVSYTAYADVEFTASDGSSKTRTEAIASETKRVRVAAQGTTVNFKVSEGLQTPESFTDESTGPKPTPAPEQQPQPEPEKGKVTYDWGEANKDGTKGGDLPTDSKSYEAGELFEVLDGSGMSWIHAEPTNSSANGFLGWSAKPEVLPEGETADTTSSVVPGQKYKMPDGGVVLTANWNKKQYSITYELNLPSDTGQTATLAQSPNNQTDITALSSVNIYDAKLEITNNPIGSKNYTFVRWNGDDGKEYAPNEEIKMLTGDLELTAEWTDKNVYTVTYVSNDKDSGSSVPAAQSHEEGENANIDFTAPTRTGYEFVGWNEGSSDTISDTAAYMSSGDTQITGINRNYTLYAVWKAKTYKVIYEPNPPNGATVTLNGAAATRQERDRTYGQSFSWESNMFTAPAGYRYGGWNTQANGQGSQLTGTPSSTYTGQANDITVYAVWTPNTYSITYYDVAASDKETFTGNTSGLPQTYTYGTTTNLVTPTTALKGFSFEGWYTNYSGTIPAANNITATTTGEVDLYAKWTMTIDMVNVTGGTFTMGEAGGSDNAEWSGVQVSTFEMGKYEVTHAQWKAVMGSLPSNMANPDDGEAGNNPVNNVSWYDAIAFCNKLSLLENKTLCYSVTDSSTGQEVDWANLQYADIPTTTNSDWDYVVCNWDADGYRLPTEAEWEYAARGGTLLRHPKYSGLDGASPIATELKTVAWYDSNANSTTHEVGTKTANALDISDMSGNVSEWCWDRYGYNDYNSANNGNKSDPRGAASGGNRIKRGGCFDIDEAWCTVSRRDSNFPYIRFTTYGFRVVCRP